jgi:hypothetical protein
MAGSLNFNVTSKRPPQLVHSYSYTGMAPTSRNAALFKNWKAIINNKKRKNKRF